jgi:predicted enzyme related to lactoylglutathione lyase
MTMPESPIQLTQMTLATTRTYEMVRFYDTLFGTQLQAIVSYGTTLYHGTLAGIPLVICPNEIAGVEAKQSRHQLTLRVADLSGLLQIVEIAGGGIHTSAAESVVSAILRDPDDNTIEVIQA